jgi:hypothetical protein
MPCASIRVSYADGCWRMPCASIRQHTIRKRGRDDRRGVGNALGAIAQTSKAPGKNTVWAGSTQPARPNLTQLVTFLLKLLETGRLVKKCQEFPSFLVSLLRVSRKCSQQRHSGFLASQQTEKFRDGHQFRDDVPDSRQQF